MPRSMVEAKSRLEIGVVPLVLTVITITLGIIGWSKIDYDGTAHSVLVILFKTLGGSKSAGASGGVPQHNLWTDSANLAGLLSIYSWVAALFWGYLRGLAIRIAARFFYRDHVVVLGDTLFARRAAKAWRSSWRRPLHVVGHSGKTGSNEIPRSIEHKLDASCVVTFALARAGHVLIDLGDDMRTLTFGLDVLTAMSNLHPPSQAIREPAAWTIVVRDVALADHFAEKVGELKSGSKTTLPDFQYLDPERLAVRYFMASRPPFLMAERRQQERVHVLVVGSEAISRHLAEMSLLASRAGKLAPAAVTVLTANPEADEHAFLSGRPTLTEAVDIAFLPLDALESLRLAITTDARALCEREDKAPFTVAFLTSNDTQSNVRVALLIDDINRKTGRLDCPLFSYEETSEEATFLTARTGRLHEIISGFATFDLPDGALVAHVCLPKERDALAKALHASYTAATPAGDAPGWYALPESLRRSNLNAADQWRAIAYTLGFGSETTPPFQLGRIARDDFQQIVSDANKEGSALLDAARFEHERWAIERRLDGWTHAKQRDNRRQLHPLLVPWDVLSQQFPSEVIKNVEHVKAIVRHLVMHGDPRWPLQLSRNVAEPAKSSLTQPPSN